MRNIGVGTFTTTPRMRQLVNNVLDNERISYGPMSQRFEQEFAAIHGCKHAVLSNSGTSSLQTALQAMKELHGWRNGDEVIVPAVTFVATLNVVLHNNLKPVLIDVEPDYYEMDPNLLEGVITNRTRAIIPVHLFGQPCDMTSISEIAHHHHLRVIEDSCECMFVSHHGSPAGSLGDIGCFSTYVAHLLTTGVGGLATTNKAMYAVKMRSLVNHGRDGIYISIDDDDHLSDEQRREVISRRFRFETIGHSCRITELEAALGVAQLESWQEMIAQRQSNAIALTAGLRPFEHYIQLPKIRPHTEHAFMMYPIVLRHEHKEDLVNFLESRGIETRDMLPLTNQPVYKKLELFDEYDYPIARWINRCGFYIGCHQNLSDDDLDYIIEAFKDFYRSRSNIIRLPVKQYGAAA